MSRRSLSASLTVGTVIRVREGWYALAGAPPELILAIRHGGVVGCLTAARAHGLWVPPHEGIHVWLRDRGHRRSHDDCTCVSHWDLPPGDHARSVTVEHALAEIAACAGEEAFFICLESAMRNGKLTKAGARWLRLVLPAASAALMDEARDDADSGIESIVRYRMLAVGITMRSQVEIAGVGRVDFLIGDRLILEIDGRDNHDGASERHKDLLRDARAAVLGYEALRFDYAMVLYDWSLVEAAIRAKVDAGEHHARTSQRS
ncbi:MULTISPECIES: endonuclease domain-containing protein [unclassified Leifsonia]|uniref:endonuclease domain-containing protein n=1 Tax=unclassified Leifsonia TaxID=2663824 RepID=UPI0006FC4206|nr:MULTISPECIES: DUF559 domain-containing protein [unclassified Leifsonia]KQX06631.1 hypothetical protein ASC59_01885 [Leifsonia sp. Root1293]KRA10915.1 hypothetical protein ASD61_01885 [Leifsonia sp. Root60]